MIIDSFRGKYRFLSNFYETDICYNGHTFMSSEHFYQASRTLNKEWQFKIINAKSASETKKLARKLDKLGYCRHNWNAIKASVMRFVLYHKFTQNHDLAQKLLSTGNAILIEGNTWHDNFFGDCRCHHCKYFEGDNYLGRLLMFTRYNLPRWQKFNLVA